jgi:hypothetical protein
MRPRSAETSELACTKRKMLSMNRRTSLPSSSRKYSAAVRARDPPARGRRRLVHLPVDEGGAGDDGVAVRELRLLHLEVEVVALARPLADAAEHRHAAVLLRDVVDELHDDDGLADAGAAEQADLAAALVGARAGRRP